MKPTTYAESQVADAISAALWWQERDGLLPDEVVDTALSILHWGRVEQEMRASELKRQHQSEGAKIGWEIRRSRKCKKKCKK